MEPAFDRFIFFAFEWKQNVLASTAIRTWARFLIGICATVVNVIWECDVSIEVQISSGFLVAFEVRGRIPIFSHWLIRTWIFIGFSSSKVIVMLRAERMNFELLFGEIISLVLKSTLTLGAWGIHRSISDKY